MKVYHISPIQNRNSILEKGLIATAKNEGRIKYSNRLYFSISKEDLAFDYVNFENVDCWEFEIDKSAIKVDDFSHSKEHFYIEKDVKPNLIKLIKSY